MSLRHPPFNLCLTHQLLTDILIVAYNKSVCNRSMNISTRAN
nr:MAG TPA: hypothetical protein [Caudoviricetes sp.]